MYHARAFAGIFRVSLVTMAIVVAMYTPFAEERLFDRVVPFIAILKRRTLALRGSLLSPPLPQGTIIKVQTPSIKVEPSRTVEKLRVKIQPPVQPALSAVMIHRDDSVSYLAVVIVARNSSERCAKYRSS